MLGRSQRYNLEEGAERQGCRSLLSIGGIICNFTPTLPYIQHWGMNVDHEFFQVSKLSEDQKKRSSPKIEQFFPRIQVKTKKKKVFTKNGTLSFPEFKWRPSLRRKPESNYWGDAVIDHTQIIGGDISQPISRVPAPLLRGLQIPLVIWKI